jgi:hypothetical protein
MSEEGAGIEWHDDIRAPVLPSAELEGTGCGRRQYWQEPMGLGSDDTRFAIFNREVMRRI